MDTARLKAMFRWAYRILAVLVNNLYCIPTYVVWCVLLHPLYYLNPDLYWQIEGQFFQWLLTMVAYWSYSAGYYIVETGDSIEDLINEETLVLVNHQSTSDVPLLMYAFSARNTLLQKLNWIMDAVFQFTNFGIVSTLHGDFFINAGRTRRDASLRDLEKFLKNKFAPRKRKWLVLFPEGGFLRKRKEASKRYAEKMKLPNLDFVTLPRMGALQTIINTLCPASENSETKLGSGFGEKRRAGHLKYIIDITIAYPNGNPLDLGAIITGYTPPCNVRMHYKIYPIDEVPFNEPDLMQNWLYKIYIEKNNMLGHYYRTGVWNPEFSKLDINNCTDRDEGIESDGEIANNAETSSECDVVDKAPSNQPELIDESALEKSLSSKEKINDGLRVRQKKHGRLDCIYDAMTEEEMKKSKGKVLHLDLLRITLLHIMFISSTLFHIAIGQGIINLALGG